MKRVAVLGSTGSIGRQAVEVIRANSGSLVVHSLVCNRNVDLLAAQSREFPGAVCGVLDPAASVPAGFLQGAGVTEEAVEGCDIVLNAFTGFAGLRASLLAARLEIPLALANKESLVTGGCLLADHIRKGLLSPVDSEHSTIARCLAGEAVRPLGVTLTASGGALRDLPLSSLADASPDMVLAHPTWSMGPRITVDSATLVNKAFEVIEARWLFPDLPVDAVLHPQSIVHSFVRLADGSWKALTGSPDMRVPIQYALLGGSGEPGLSMNDGPLDWPSLTFGRIDPARYPAYSIVIAAGELGGAAPVAANAADEVAVEAFLAGRIGFGRIPEVIENALGKAGAAPVSSYGDVLRADEEARARSRAFLGERC